MPNVMLLIWKNCSEKCGIDMKKDFQQNTFYLRVFALCSLVVPINFLTCFLISLICFGNLIT